MNDKLLAIYLNDHLAGATMGTELTRRALSNNRGTPYGAFLEELERAIEEDKATLQGLMATLGVGENKIKQGGAWIAERVGRLKLNGQITGYSPLSRLIEFESLVIGVTGKLALWRALRDLADQDPRLAVTDFEELIRRAESQIEGLEKHHLAAAIDALT